jgi:protease-4
MVDMVKLDDYDSNKDDSKKIIKRRQTISLRKIFFIFLFLFLFFSILSSIVYELSPKIAVFEIYGPIMGPSGSGDFFSEGVNSRKISQEMYSIANDGNYKGVILDINSPGGSPVASEEISKAIDNLKKHNITVYTVYNDLGASGAFWIGESANKVYASSMSAVGSIGVTSAGLSFENFIKRYNITYRRLVAGKYKDIGTPFRNMTPEERKMIEGILYDIYGKFINHIATERGLNYSYVKQYADGKIYLGDKAKEIGFVDKIGDYHEALSDLKNNLNETDEKIIVVKFSDKPSFLDSLAGTMFDYKSLLFSNSLFMLN